MHDEDNSGFLDRNEIIKIVQAHFLHDKSMTAEVMNERVKKILLAGGGHRAVGRGQLSFKEFVVAAEADGSLLFPSRSLMDKAHRRIAKKKTATQDAMRQT